jgi:hypothetical protein
MEIMDIIYYAKQKKYNYWGGIEDEKADDVVGDDCWDYRDRPE